MFFQQRVDIGRSNCRNVARHHENTARSFSADKPDGVVQAFAKITDCIVGYHVMAKLTDQAGDFCVVG